MKFSFSLAAIAILSIATNAFVIPNNGQSLSRRDLDIDALSKRAPADSTTDDGSDIPDDQVADITDAEATSDIEFTEEDLKELAEFRAIKPEDVPEPSDEELDAIIDADNSLSERDEYSDIEERGLKERIIKWLFKKISKSKLGKKVWNKIPKKTRKRITKYVKKASKTKKGVTKKTKKWLAREIKPFVLSVITQIIGKTAANWIINDVVPFVVKVLLEIIY